MARSSITVYDPRRIWGVNVAPVIAGARAGTDRARRTVRSQRDRARHPHRWRRRLLAGATAGVALAAVARSGYTLAARRRRAARGADPAGAGITTDTGFPEPAAPAAGSPPAGVPAGAPAAAGPFAGGDPTLDGAHPVAARTTT